MAAHWLHKGLNGIGAQADNIRFLHNPDEFYRTLVEKVKSSQKRVLLTSLYLGTGPLEQALVEAIDNAVKEKPRLKVSLLFDYLRGTRGGDASSAGILKRLADRINAYFFHTPNLRGIVKQVLPERVNEVVGLQHMKFFIFDNSIIISGANLSDTYFTNRQDRYVLIEDNKELVEFFEAIFEAVASCSFKLQPDGALEVHESCSHHPFEDDPDQFKNMLFTKTAEATAQLTRPSKNSDTYIYPFLQMGPFGIRQEQDFMKNLFSRETKDVELSLASGYLNFYDEYSDLMLNEARFPMEILLASPEANGFYGAHGLTAYVPALYVYISELFYRKVKELGRDIILREYKKPSWSFHAKGIWIRPTRESWRATVIGSSNFGYRSTLRDLESQILIVTTNEMLKKRMNDEKKFLFEHTQLLDDVVLSRPDHTVPTWVRYFTRAFRNFF